MKKFMLTLFAAVGLCSVSFAADPFIGWECKDNAALKAAIAKSNDDVKPSDKAHYALMIANNENPANVDTLAKCTEIVKNAYAAAGVKNVSEDSVFFVIIQNFWCRNDKTILKEIVASPLSQQRVIISKNGILSNVTGLTCPKQSTKTFCLRTSNKT